MTIDVSTAVGILAGAVTAFGGLYTGVRALLAASRRRKAEYRQAILDEAQIEMDKIEASMQEQVRALAMELETQKSSVARDMDHMREIYNSELKVLGQKIDDLKQDLAAQHSSMVALLTKLVDSR